MPLLRRIATSSPATSTVGLGCLVFLFFFGLGGGGASAASGAPLDLDWSALVREADAATGAGRLTEAADFFARARKLVPQNLVPLRGACDVALARQRAGESLSSREPCHRAFLLGAQPEDMYREVASVMYEPAAPSLDTTVLLSFAAEAAVHRASNQPWGYLARCEIGRRLGLADVLEGCITDLKRVAPDSPQTARMVALARGRAPLWIWALRLLLVLVPLGTLAHSLMRRTRSRPTSRFVAARTLAVTLVVAALSSVAGTARAALVEKDGHPVMENDQISTFVIDDANPEASVPSLELQNQKPLQFGYFLQDLIAKVTRAEHDKDLPAVVRYYRAITKASPRSPYGPRKLCAALQAVGDIDGAIIACRTATVIEGTTVDDFRNLVRVIIAKKGSLPKERRDEAYAAIEHLQIEAPIGTGIDELRCEAALRFEDFDTLAGCAGRLAQAAPNDNQTVSFQWALAVHERDKAKAESLVERARYLHMDPAGIQRMEATNRAMSTQPLWRALAVGAVLALLAGAWQWSAKRRLARI